MYTYPKEVKSVSWGDVCTSMLLAALLTVAKMWKQPVEGQMDKENVLHLHNGLLFILKEEEI